MLEKRKFDLYVAGQPLVANNVYGNEYSIELNLKEVQDKKLSNILGKYVNDKRAIIDGEYAYIVPEYDKYQLKNQNYRMQKLLQYVNEKNYITMLNESSIVIEKLSGDETFQYYFKVLQNDIKKYKCMVIVALLIDAGLAKIDVTDDSVCIIYNYVQQLEKQTKIQKDLSGFRILLGESSNIGKILDLIERSKVMQGELYITMGDVQKNDCVLEMLSLVDVGLAVSDKSYDNEVFKIDRAFANWLLEYISNTSDRISFGDLFSM